MNDGPADLDDAAILDAFARALEDRRDDPSVVTPAPVVMRFLEQPIGKGKTQEAMQAIVRDVAADIKAKRDRYYMIFAPTVALGEQITDDLRLMMDAASVNPELHLWHYRGWEAKDREGSPLCKRPGNPVKVARERGLLPSSGCQSGEGENKVLCPYAGSCDLYRQHFLIEEQPRVVVTQHAYLTLGFGSSEVWGRCDAAVIDEDPSQTLIKTADMRLGDLIRGLETVEARATAWLARTFTVAKRHAKAIDKPRAFSCVFDPSWLPGGEDCLVPVEARAKKLAERFRRAPEMVRTRKLAIAMLDYLQNGIIGGGVRGRLPVDGLPARQDVLAMAAVLRQKTNAAAHAEIAAISPGSTVEDLKKLEKSAAKAPPYREMAEVVEAITYGMGLPPAIDGTLCNVKTYNPDNDRTRIMGAMAAPLDEAMFGLNTRNVGGKVITSLKEVKLLSAAVEPALLEPFVEAVIAARRRDEDGVAAPYPLPGEVAEIPFPRVVGAAPAVVYPEGAKDETIRIQFGTLGRRWGSDSAIASGRDKIVEFLTDVARWRQRGLFVAGTETVISGVGDDLAEAMAGLPFATANYRRLIGKNEWGAENGFGVYAALSRMLPPPMPVEMQCNAMAGGQIALPEPFWDTPQVTLEMTDGTSYKGDVPSHDHPMIEAYLRQTAVANLQQAERSRGLRRDGDVAMFFQFGEMPGQFRFDAVYCEPADFWQGSLEKLPREAGVAMSAADCGGKGWMSLLALMAGESDIQGRGRDRMRDNLRRGVMRKETRAAIAEVLLPGTMRREVTVKLQCDGKRPFSARLVVPVTAEGRRDAIEEGKAVAEAAVRRAIDKVEDKVEILEISNVRGETVRGKDFTWRR